MQDDIEINIIERLNNKTGINMQIITNDNFQEISNSIIQNRARNDGEFYITADNISEGNIDTFLEGLSLSKIKVRSLTLKSNNPHFVSFTTCKYFVNENIDSITIGPIDDMNGLGGLLEDNISSHLINIFRAINQGTKLTSICFDDPTIGIKMRDEIAEQIMKALVENGKITSITIRRGDDFIELAKSEKFPLVQREAISDLLVMNAIPDSFAPKKTLKINRHDLCTQLLSKNDASDIANQLLDTQSEIEKKLNLKQQEIDQKRQQLYEINNNVANLLKEHELLEQEFEIKREKFNELNVDVALLIEEYEKLSENLKSAKQELAAKQDEEDELEEGLLQNVIDQLSSSELHEDSSPEDKELDEDKTVNEISELLENPKKEQKNIDGDDREERDPSPTPRTPHNSSQQKTQ